MREPNRVVLYSVVSRVVNRVVNRLDDSQIDAMSLLVNPSQL
jgi:hypothetical protein